MVGSGKCGWVMLVLVLSGCWSYQIIVNKLLLIFLGVVE